MTSDNYLTSHLIPAVFFLVNVVATVECHTCSRGQVLDDGLLGGPYLLTPSYITVLLVSCKQLNASIKFKNVSHI